MTVRWGAAAASPPGLGMAREARTATMTTVQAATAIAVRRADARGWKMRETGLRG